MLQVVLIGLLIIMIYMTVIWLVSLPMKNSGIGDIFWGPGFALVAWVYFALTPEGFSTRKLVIATLVTIWGLRLAWHIGRRNLGHEEDYRYKAWRVSNGSIWWWKSYFQVFALQGFLLWIISTPLMMAQFASEPANLTLFDGLGVIIWLIGFLFETVGDWQLTRFKSNPANKGKVMHTGLWRYTRHPNYFGDATLWWGYFLIALSVPNGFFSIFSPILMTVMLMRVSGVAMLEQNLKKTKPEYTDYIATTNAFFPGSPHKQPDAK